jgi:nucleotide-binding universal stress UspA family protein
MVCCWDGSQAAARAFMLTNAETVDLLIAQNEKTKNDDQEIRGVDMAAHLARPDVKVEIEIIPAADFDVADTVLSYAAENSATLIVMGGYGHARLRELILGGVTRDILKSMTVPVVSH